MRAAAALHTFCGCKTQKGAVYVLRYAPGNDVQHHEIVPSLDFNLLTYWIVSSKEVTVAFLLAVDLSVWRQQFEMISVF